MRLLRLLPLHVLCGFSAALNIILNNDDGWASANIREFYKALKAAGHNVWLVAPVTNQSGKGGTAVFTDQANLTGPGVHNSVPAGAPSFGHDPQDNQIWYYNGTPAATTFFALDYIVPNFFPANTTPDLLVAGPNEGENLGPFLFTLSGTIGATYAAVGRGLPAIAFSAQNSTVRSFTDVNSDDKNDPAILAAKLATALVQELAGSANSTNSSSARILPEGYGISVNFPLLGASCSDPAFVKTRIIGGGAVSDSAVLDETTGLFTFGNADVVDVCINGDCSLPGETDVVTTGDECSTSVSVFTVDYDAPNVNGGQQSQVFSKFGTLVVTQNSTSGSGNGDSEGSVPVSGTESNLNGTGLPAGFGANGKSTGSSTATPPASTGGAGKLAFNLGWVVLGAAVLVGL